MGGCKSWFCFSALQDVDCDKMKNCIVCSVCLSVTEGKREMLLETNVNLLFETKSSVCKVPNNCSANNAKAFAIGAMEMMLIMLIRNAQKCCSRKKCQ
jgi:hypothetical protein